MTVYFPVFVARRAASTSATATRSRATARSSAPASRSRSTCSSPSSCSRASAIGWPRGENDDYIFTVGNARPLDQALQHATTEMMRWLNEDYGLDCRRQLMLLGQCIRYEIGNVFDPAYTMIAKIEKRYLPNDEAVETMKVKAEPLTAEAYAPFGKVVDVARHRLHCQPGEYTARLHALERGQTLVRRVNRHSDHEQLFVPISGPQAADHASRRESTTPAARVRQRRHAGVDVRRQRLAQRAARRSTRTTRR